MRLFNHRTSRFMSTREEGGEEGKLRASKMILRERESESERESARESARERQRERAREREREREREEGREGEGG